MKQIAYIVEYYQKPLSRIDLFTITIKNLFEFFTHDMWCNDCNKSIKDCIQRNKIKNEYWKEAGINEQWAIKSNYPLNY